METVNNLDINTLVPALMLIAGWMLNELSVLLRTRGEKGRNLSMALAELLEIHHSLIGKKLVIDECKHRYGLNIEHQPEFKFFFEILEFDMNDISKRYSEAVTLISGYDPLLAFNLRNKDKITPLLNKLKKFGQGDEEVEQFMLEITKKFESSFIPVLEDAIRDVAWKKGKMTWFKTKIILGNKQNIVGSMFNQLSEFIPKTN